MLQFRLENWGYLLYFGVWVTPCSAQIELCGVRVELGSLAGKACDLASAANMQIRWNGGKRMSWRKERRCGLANVGWSRLVLTLACGRWSGSPAYIWVGEPLSLLAILPPAFVPGSHLKDLGNSSQASFSLVAECGGGMESYRAKVIDNIAPKAKDQSWPVLGTHGGVVNITPDPPTCQLSPMLYPDFGTAFQRAVLSHTDTHTQNEKKSAIFGTLFLGEKVPELCLQS